MSLQLQPDAVVLNGQTSYRGFNIDGLFHPVEPIEQLITLTCKHFNNSQIYSLNLQNYVKSDLKVIATYGFVNRENTLGRRSNGIGKLFFKKNNFLEEFITFDLKSQPSNSLFILRKNIDIKHDDAESITEAQYHSGNTPLIFFLIEPETNKLVRKLTASITGFPVEKFFFIYRKNLDIYIKSSAGFHSLTFYCEPIYLSNVIEPTKLE